MMQLSGNSRSLRSPAGFSLVELMIALLIGAFLIIGAVTVYLQSRGSFETNDRAARLQENARYAFTMLEPDIRMSRFWGRTSRTNAVTNRATPADPIPAGLGVVNDCTQNWSIDLSVNIEATNAGVPFACPSMALIQPNSDFLGVRHATVQPTVPTPGRMQIQSDRMIAQLFANGIVPALPAASTTHDLIVNGYYISPQSVLGPNVPSLRRQTLVTGAAGGQPVLQDQEIIPGVQDMQIQFGIDVDPIGAPNRGTVDRYSNPGDPILNPLNVLFNPNAQIVAVRIWLLMRSQRPEIGHNDGAVYQYADQNVGPFNDNFRRLLVSQTIALRNVRQEN